MASVEGTTSRKPSGSSTHSGTHSPSQNGSRRLTPSSNGFVVGMDGALGSLVNGWQVWEGASPSTGSEQLSGGTMSVSSQETHTTNHSFGVQSRQRQATAAQAAALAAHDLKDGTVNGTGRRVVSAPNADEEKRQKSGPRYEKDLNGLYVPTMPAKTLPNGTGVYPPSPYHTVPAPSSGHPPASYDPSGFKSVDDLALGLRGLQVAESYDAAAHPAYRAAVHSPVQASHMQIPAPNGVAAPSQPHIPANIHPSRAAYHYPHHPDYTPYYPTSSPVADGYSDQFSYGYETYRASPDLNGYVPQQAGVAPARQMYQSPQLNGMHPHAHPEAHRPSTAMYYPEYTGPARQPAPYFYHTPPMHHAVVYHPPQPQSPLHSQMTAAAATAASLSDKKRELQNMQNSLDQQAQQLAYQQNAVMASIRSQPTPSPHQYPASNYPAGLPLSMMSPGTPAMAFSPHMSHMMHASPQVYAMGVRRPRERHDLVPRDRSAVLEEFRANKTRKWELRNIIGHVVEFSGDQHGSRFIQQKLESSPIDERQLVFDEILPDHTLPLITDVFGNYVIQKLFEFGTQAQKTILFETMRGNVVQLSLQMYGCRVVQKAVEFILPEQQAAFVKELSGHILKCVKDANGNHVVQKLIERVAPERLTFVEAFKGNVLELSTHPYGCRVLQRCFEHLTEEQTRPLLDELHAYTASLMQDQFGNYVIQFVLEHGQPQDRAQIIGKLRTQMLTMAKHKFASNVCEKALMTADSESRRLLIEELMTPRADGVSPVIVMMKDQYANYVLQRTLHVVEGDQREALAAKIRPQLAGMRRYQSTYSKHLTAIEKLLEEKCPASSAIAHAKPSSLPPVPTLNIQVVPDAVAV